ncbi:MAG: putative deacylase [Myxococcota bacterium]|jgi:predicted deacylase
MPVLSLTGPAPGPVVVITANLHGDECTGIGVIHRLLKVLPRTLQRGTVHLYPSLNPDGLIRQTRSIPGADRDPNRAFPGRTGGDRVERHAARIWRDIIARKPALLIDLHTDSCAAIPYAIADRVIRGRGRDTLMRRCLTFARASGLTVLREYPNDLYARYKLDQSLPGAMVNNLGIPAITLEVGPRGIVQHDAVETALAATGGVLTELGVLQAPAPVSSSRVDGGPWRRASGPVFTSEGVYIPKLKAGERFNAGAMLGEVIGLDGGTRQLLLTAAAGFVVALPDRTWVRPGQTSSTLGVVDR